MLRNLCCHIRDAGNNSLVEFSSMPDILCFIVLPVMFLITGDIYIKKHPNFIALKTSPAPAACPAAEFTSDR